MNSPTHRCQSLLASIIGFGLVASTLSPVQALPHRDRMPISSPQTRALTLALKQNPRNPTVLPDGTYLYGQSDKPEQIGREYLVFKVAQGKVRGAIYYPRSEFNCFTGRLNNQQMKLSIRDPQDNRSYPYNIALVSTSPIVDRELAIPSFTLKDYFRLQQLSQTDQQILNICLNQGK